MRSFVNSSVMVFALTLLLVAASAAADTDHEDHGKPFGLFRYLPVDARRDGIADFTRVAPHQAKMAAEVGLRVVVGIAGGRSKYSDSAGCFDLEMWKESAWANTTNEIQDLIKHGSLIGVYALDEPHDWNCGPTFKEINDICSYAHQLLGAVKCGINAPPSWLQQGLNVTDFSDVDFIVSQYNFRRGPPEPWIEGTLASAHWFHGEVWLSVNIETGAPSADDVKKVGEELCTSQADAVMIWKWGDRLENDPEMQEVLRSVRSICAAGLKARRPPDK